MQKKSKFSEKLRKMKKKNLTNFQFLRLALRSLQDPSKNFIKPISLILKQISLKYENKSLNFREKASFTRLTFPELWIAYFDTTSAIRWNSSAGDFKTRLLVGTL